MTAVIHILLIFIVCSFVSTLWLFAFVVHRMLRDPFHYSFKRSGRPWRRLYHLSENEWEKFGYRLDKSHEED